MIPFPPKRYDIVYADPPWEYPGTGEHSAASMDARRHYKTMPNEDIMALPVRSIMEREAALFLWATCPKLHVAIDTIRAWGLHYRGVAFVWVKVSRTGPNAGRIMNGCGTVPTFTKPVSELVLVATTKPDRRPFPIQSLTTEQVILAPRGRHSAKPDVFRQKIVELCGDRSRIELFAREVKDGWDVWGNEVGHGAPGVEGIDSGEGGGSEVGSEQASGDGSPSGRLVVVPSGLQAGSPADGKQLRFFG